MWLWVSNSNSSKAATGTAGRSVRAAGQPTLAARHSEWANQAAEATKGDDEVDYLHCELALATFLLIWVVQIIKKILALAL